MATVQLRWSDGTTGVSLSIPAKTNVDVEPSGYRKLNVFRWMDGHGQTEELFISPGGSVVIEAEQETCSTCQLPLAEYAGPGRERGTLCLTPGCEDLFTSDTDWATERPIASVDCIASEDDQEQARRLR